MHLALKAFVLHVFNLLDLRPVMATSVSVATAAANAGVWMELIKGWAAVATLVLGVPTAFFILVYWALKARYEFKNRNIPKGQREL